MTINELRVGNIVKTKYQPDGFYVDKFSIMHFNNRKYEPIPLTEEILLKCGFKKNISAERITFNSDWFGIYNNYLYYKDSESGEYIQYGNACIIFVHQLQNIYFSLTGEELEVEL